jgi:hypothetical protein
MRANLLHTSGVDWLLLFWHSNRFAEGVLRDIVVANIGRFSWTLGAVAFRAL